jgi:hypothetical protein
MLKLPTLDIVGEVLERAMNAISSMKVKILRYRQACGTVLEGQEPM